MTLRATSSSRGLGRLEKTDARGELSGRAFARAREELARELYAEMNRNVFGGALPPDLDIKWTPYLRSTAGTTHYKRTQRVGEAPVYHARIELATKVLDTAAKLRRTLCHEMCHVAAWLIDHVAKPPHGAHFKRWARCAMERYPDLDVSTCHNYDIHYAHRWQCGACRREYGRHSRSIDPNKHRCGGGCGGQLTYLGRSNPDGTPCKARTPSAYNAFVKDNMAVVRSELGAGTPSREIMKELSQRYRASKAQLNEGDSARRAAQGDAPPTADELEGAMRRLDLL
ncbi:unnamed protein product [Pedinophyceae sp. YPF-701]|nr:unnamed protein product [Pedinophyceae sp. YPF-701]